MLPGCGAGLVLIHDSNPLLRGLNWMGAALVAGGVGSGLMLASASAPALLPLANLALLLAFVMCNRADRYLIGHEAKQSRLSLALLACQIGLAVLEWCHLIGFGVATAGVSVLAAVQIAATSLLLKRGTVGRMRLATRFTIGIMLFLAVANLFRAGLALAGLLTGSPWTDLLNLVTFNVFVATAIALAFAFFWRTTARLSEELEHMASTDPLTRVFNRRVFLKWCESEQLRSQRLHAPFSVLMLDFDHFKAVNDTFGHHIGDQVLCAAVERIQDSIRGIDVLCRWGGEEFAVLLPNASDEATLIVAERVRRNVRSIASSDPRFAEDAFAELQLSVSIGTATIEGEDDTFEAMLQRADGALYEAKHSGRNRVIRSQRSRSENAPASMNLALETL